MNDPSPAVARVAFERGELRGTQLELHPGSLVHRGPSHLETLPLAAISAVRLEFVRDARKLGWGIALFVAALILLAITGPLGTFASHAAAGQQSIPAMYAIYRAIEAVASMMPVAALACVIGGGLLSAFGWMGRTTLLVSLPGGERLYAARGRDAQLLDFSQALTDRLTLVRK